MTIDLGRILWWHAGLVGAAGILSYATHLGEPVSLFLGGVVMGANFALIRIMVTMLLAPGEKPRRKVWALSAFIGKTALFLALIIGIFLRLPIEGMSFAFGASALIAAILIETARSQLVLKGVG